MKIGKFVSVICAAVISAAALPAFNVSAGTNDGWKKAYASFLKQEIKKSAEDDPDDILAEKGFSVQDLDSDGIPELMVSGGGWHMAQCSVYRYLGGKKLKKIGDLGEFGVVSYYPESGTLRSGYSGMGYTFFEIIKLKNGKFETLVSFSDDSAAVEADPTYEINGKAVSESTYYKKRIEYDSEITYSLGKTFSLDESSIKCALGGYGNYKTAYKNYLKTKIPTQEWQSERFFIKKDITGDSVPELFVYDDYGDFNVFSYSGGRMQLFTGCYSGFGNARAEYDSAAKMLCFSGSSEYGCSYYFYNIENGKASLAWAFSEYSDYSGDTPQNIYYINGAKVSKEMWESSLNEFKGKYTLKKLGKICKLTEAGISKAF